MLLQFDRCADKFNGINLFYKKEFVPTFDFSSMKAYDDKQISRWVARNLSFDFEKLNNQLFLSIL